MVKMNKIEKFLIATLLTTTLSTSFLSLADEIQHEPKPFNAKSTSFEHANADRKIIEYYSNRFDSIKDLPGIEDRQEVILNELMNENNDRDARLETAGLEDLADKATFEEYLYNASLVKPAPENAPSSQAAEAINAVNKSTTTEELGSAIEQSQETSDTPGKKHGTDETPQTDFPDNTDKQNVTNTSISATQEPTATSTQEPTAISSPEVTPSVAFKTTIVDPTQAVYSVNEEVGGDIVNRLVEVISREVNPDKSLTVDVSAEADEILEPAMKEIDKLYDKTIRLLHLELKQRPNRSLTREVEDASIEKFAYIEEIRALAKNSFKDATMEVARSRNRSEYLDGIAENRLKDLREEADNHKRQREYEKELEANEKIRRIQEARERAKTHIFSKASEAVQYILKTKTSFLTHDENAKTALEKTERGLRLDNIVENKRPVKRVSPEELAEHYSSLLQQAEELSNKITSVRGFKEEDLVIFLSQFDNAAPSNKKGMFKSLFEAVTSAVNK